MRPAVAVTEFLYAHEYAAKSLIWYQQMLGVFTSFCDVEQIADIGEVSAPLVRRFFDTVRARTDPRTGQPISSQSVHGYARAVRALLNWCVREGLLDERVPRRIAMPKREQKVIATLSVDQIERLLRAAQSARDKAIIAVLLDTGLRANELCTLTLDHVHFTPEGAWLLVHGKRDKWREVGLGKRSRQALHKYIYRERSHYAERDEQRVFVGTRGRGPLTPNGLDQVLYALRDAAGREHFQGVRVRAHVFRHSFAVNYLAQGGDVFKLSRLMGHTSVTTTQE
ncbi:MAG TPA: tyrosine-type recombinase/integrase [Ktedonobacterales bacterium]|jgi:site-specific recombinase XerD|nr:tyrosine-type recombinase/integrase [Ktedonobacterales bacterium]